VCRIIGAQCGLVAENLFHGYSVVTQLRDAFAR